MVDERPAGRARAAVRLAGDRWLLVDSVAARLVATRSGDVLPLLQEVEQRAASGQVLVGWIAYEAAAGLDRALRVQRSRPGADRELMCFLVADRWREVAGAGWRSPRLGVTAGALKRRARWRWNAGVAHDRYVADVDRIRAAIRRGDVYQVNYTFPLLGRLAGRSAVDAAPGAGGTSLDGVAWQLFRDLQRAQRGEYAAWIDDGSRYVCSASPEMFFELEGDLLTSRPMKGTARRGLDVAGDGRALEALRSSDKERAENLMIVDMVRNDLARVARPGSVRVTELFGLETFPTVHQMVSTVQAETGAGLTEIVRALFPAASITGAPKAASMDEIARLEVASRGIYTGAVGAVLPGRRARFSVAIRTAVVDRQAAAVYGTGSGVVWDSEAESEWRECEAKGRNLSYRLPRFRLLETLLWTPVRGFVWRRQHLGRLVDASRYFGFAIDRGQVAQALEAEGRRLMAQRGGPRLVRLLVSGTGRIELQARALQWRPRSRWRVALAHEEDRPVQSTDRFLRHKTTWRAAYRRALRQATSRHGAVEDVLLFNERGELTESTRANVVVALGRGREPSLLTPPAEAGLLPGVLRGELLRRGRLTEATIQRDQLDAATGVWLINSVRGIVRVDPVGWRHA